MQLSANIDVLATRLAEAEAECEAAREEVMRLRETCGDLRNQRDIAREEAVRLTETCGGLRKTCGELKVELGSARGDASHEHCEASIARLQHETSQVLRKWNFLRWFFLVTSQSYHFSVALKYGLR